MKILIIVPTRNRPDNVKRFHESLVTTAPVDVLYCVDEDDNRLIDYLCLNVPIRVVERKRLVGTLNEISREFVDEYDVIGFLGDDTLCKTHRWDATLTSNFKRNMVAYGNDGHQREGLPTGVFLDSRIIKILGYMVPPTFIHLFADNYWKALGEALGTLTYLDDVDIEHLHPYAGKASHDRTYEEANSGSVWENDEKAFHSYVENQLQKDVEKLNA